MSSPTPQSTNARIGTCEYVQEVNSWLDYRDKILFPDGNTSFSLSLEQTGGIMPGTIAVWGSSAVPLVLTTNNVVHEPNIIAAVGIYKNARVVALAHDGFNKAIKEADAHNHPFMMRMQEWLKESNQSQDILISTGNASLDELTSHAENGGGILICICPWGWEQVYKASIANDMPENQFLALIGMSFTTNSGESLNEDVLGTYPVQASRACRSALINSMMGISLHELVCTSDNSFNNGPLAKHTVNHANVSSSLPQSALDTLIPIALQNVQISDVPSSENPLNKNSVTGAAISVVLPFLVLTGTPIPGAEFWPGMVDSRAHSKVSRDIDVYPVNWHKWVSTHLFLNAGDKITLTLRHGDVQKVVNDWRLRIGQHVDNIQDQNEWKRWPQISLVKSLRGLENGSIELSSPFGGLLFFQSASYEAESCTIAISGAYEAPRFVKKEGVFIDGPAPWGEIQGNNLSIFLPKNEMQKVSSKYTGYIEKVADYWDKVIQSHQELASPPYQNSLERIGPDVQISCGYMHSGHPVGCHMDFAERACDLVSLYEKGDWGMFHELGHNMQRYWWTWDGSVEVTVNLFTLYTMKHFLGKLGSESHEGLENSQSQEKIDRYVAGGRNIAVWNEDPFLALAMYYQLIGEFGWDALKEVFKRYENDSSLQTTNLNATDNVERFMVQYSKVVHRNLSKFFANWGFHISRGHDPEIVNLVEWDVQPAVAYEAPFYI